MKQLNTVSEIVKHFGGQEKLAARLRTSQSVVSRWKTRNWFSPDTFFALTAMLEAENCAAPRSLWRMKELDGADRG